jgi:hypothetical protein
LVIAAVCPSAIFTTVEWRSFSSRSFFSSTRQKTQPGTATSP